MKTSSRFMVSLICCVACVFLLLACSPTSDSPATNFPTATSPRGGSDSPDSGRSGKIEVYSNSEANHTPPADVLQEVAYYSTGGPGDSTWVYKDSSKAQLIEILIPMAMSIDKSLQLSEFAPNERIRILCYRLDESKGKADLVSWQVFNADQEGQLHIETRQSSCTFVAIGDISGEVYPQNEYGSYAGFTESIFVPSSSVQDEANSTSIAPSMNQAPTISAAGIQGRIAFVSDRDGNFEIYIMNADRSEQKRLTNHPADDIIPQWSPDGTRIAFISSRDGNEEIYIMNADGTQLVNLTNNPAQDKAMAWSPEGTRIAFESDRDNHSNIFLMNADGSDLIKLTNSPIDLGATWSPDSKRIAFSHGEIFVVNTDGSNLVRLTETSGGQSGSPAWSPNGRYIAFMSFPDGNGEKIYVMNADGSNLIRLKGGIERCFSPVWVPDSKRITFRCCVGEGTTCQNWQTWLVNIDGSGLTALTDNSGMPSWSSNGKYVAFVSSRDGNTEIYVMNTDGSNPINLTNHPAKDMWPSWSP